MHTIKFDGKTATLFVFNQIISPFEILSEIVTDHGSHFQNEMMKQLASKLGFKHTHSLMQTPTHSLGSTRPLDLWSFDFGIWISSQAPSEPLKPTTQVLIPSSQMKNMIFRGAWELANSTRDRGPKPWDKPQIFEEFRTSELSGFGSLNRMTPRSFQTSKWWSAK